MCTLQCKLTFVVDPRTAAGQAGIFPGTCADCAPGTFAPQDGYNACLSCPMGTYADATNSTACMACPLGTYADTTNNAACTHCPTGHWSSNVGSTSLAACVLQPHSALACLSWVIPSFVRYHDCHPLWAYMCATQASNGHKFHPSKR